MSKIIPFFLILGLLGGAAYYFLASNTVTATKRVNEKCMSYTSYLPGDATKVCSCLADAIGPEVAKGYDMGKIKAMGDKEFLSVMGFALSEQAVRDDISDCTAEAIGMDPQTLDKALTALSKIW